MAPVKLSKEEESVLANVIETGKRTCGMSIDQADGLISPVIVTGCAWVDKKNRKKQVWSEVRSRERERAHEGGSRVRYCKLEGYWGHTFLAGDKSAFYYEASGRSDWVVSLAHKLRWSFQSRKSLKGPPWFLSPLLNQLNQQVIDKLQVGDKNE